MENYNGKIKLNHTNQGEKAMKKFILTDETIEIFGATLHRIKAVRSFGNVKEGDLGGFIEKEENLSQSGSACIWLGVCI